MDDRLRQTQSIPEGDYNVDVKIEAGKDGIEMSNGIFISWDWILSASKIVRQETPHTADAHGAAGTQNSAS